MKKVVSFSTALLTKLYADVEDERKHGITKVLRQNEVGFLCVFWRGFFFKGLFFLLIGTPSLSAMLVRQSILITWRNCIGMM